MIVLIFLYYILWLLKTPIQNSWIHGYSGRYAESWCDWDRGRWSAVKTPEGTVRRGLWWTFVFCILSSFPIPLERRWTLTPCCFHCCEAPSHILFQLLFSGALVTRRKVSKSWGYYLYHTSWGKIDSVTVMYIQHGTMLTLTLQCFPQCFTPGFHARCDVIIIING